LSERRDNLSTWRDFYTKRTEEENMTEVMELESAMMPTIVRRVHGDAIETMNRRAGDQELLCVFWSIEHAERDMEAGGFRPEDGWKAIERDDEELARAFDVLQEVVDKPLLAYLEPCPEDESLCGVFEPAVLVDMLKRSLEDS